MKNKSGEQGEQQTSTFVQTNDDKVTVQSDESDKGKSSEPDKTSLSGKFLTFKLDNEYYALGIELVQDIICIVDITRVPQTANFVTGLINLRGKVIPVIDLRLTFGMSQADYNKETCIIIVNGTKGLIGIIVDIVSEVIDVKENEVESAPDFGRNIDTDFILGMSKINNDVKILIDIEKILENSKMIVEG